MAAVVNETPSILARVDRLDITLGFLEEGMKGSRSASTTTSSETMTASDGGNSSVNSSPKSLLTWRRCRPMHDVVTETRVKGNLVDRIGLLESRSRILKLEEEIEHEKRSPRGGEKRGRGKGLRRLVKSCVRGELETKE